jgi:hypothetical protein
VHGSTNEKEEERLQNLGRNKYIISRNTQEAIQKKKKRKEEEKKRKK